MSTGALLLGPVPAAAGATAAASPSMSGATAFPVPAQRAHPVAEAPPSPGPGARPASAGTVATTYRVRKADTISHIAARFGVPARDLLRANNLDRRALIHPGRLLTVPARIPAGTGQHRATVATTVEGRSYPAATMTAAQANLDALHGRRAPDRAQMRRIVSETARAHQLDPALALAVCQQESGCSMRQVSPANAIGAMQVLPSSGRWAAGLAGRDLDLLDPRDNALAGVLILRANLRAAGGDVGHALGGYYQGLSSIRRNGMYPDTRRYVTNVQSLARQYR